MTNVQPSYYVKQELDRMEKPSGSMDHRSRSPKRGPSNSPGRVANALKDSHGVGMGGNVSAYLNRSPLNLAASRTVNNRGASGSPLRQKSPAARGDAMNVAALTATQASYPSRAPVED